MPENDEILLQIYGRIIAAGLSREELDSQKHLSVAPGMTVGDYIEMRLDLGNLEWRGDKLVPTSQNGASGIHR